MIRSNFDETDFNEFRIWTNFDVSCTMRDENGQILLRIASHCFEPKKSGYCFENCAQDAFIPTWEHCQICFEPVANRVLFVLRDDSMLSHTSIVGHAGLDELEESSDHGLRHRCKLPWCTVLFVQKYCENSSRILRKSRFMHKMTGKLRNAPFCGPK